MGNRGQYGIQVNRMWDKDKGLTPLAAHKAWKKKENSFPGLSGSSAEPTLGSLIHIHIPKEDRNSWLSYSKTEDMTEKNFKSMQETLPSEDAMAQSTEWSVQELDFNWVTIAKVLIGMNT